MLADFIEWTVARRRSTANRMATPNIPAEHITVGTQSVSSGPNAPASADVAIRLYASLNR